MGNDRKSLVLIEWVDSAGATSAWRTMDDIRADTALCQIRSVGWIAHEDEVSVVLVPHVGLPSEKHIPEQGTGVMTIPRCAIKVIAELTPKAASDAARELAA